MRRVPVPSGLFLLLLLAFSLLPAACGGQTATAPDEAAAPAVPPDEAAAARQSMHHFLRHAVSYGLHEDNASRERALEIAADDTLFVLKCPICDAVRAGFVHYAGEAGEGTLEALPGALRVDEDVTRARRHAALTELVADYTRRAYARLAMTPEQIEAMQAQLAEGRERGMSAIQEDFGPSCPSCEGAVQVL